MDRRSLFKTAVACLLAPFAIAAKPVRRLVPKGWTRRHRTVIPADESGTGHEITCEIYTADKD